MVMDYGATKVTLADIGVADPWELRFTDGSQELLPHECRTGPVPAD